MKRAYAIVLVAAAVAASLPACKKKVTQEQCEQLLDRYAQLVVTAKMKDAPPEAVRAEQQREREAAKSDDDFKNCMTELSTDDYTCAMGAKTPDALEKCLE